MLNNFCISGKTFLSNPCPPEWEHMLIKSTAGRLLQPNPLVSKWVSSVSETEHIWAAVSLLQLVLTASMVCIKKSNQSCSFEPISGCCTCVHVWHRDMASSLICISVFLIWTCHPLDAGSDNYLLCSKWGISSHRAFLHQPRSLNLYTVQQCVANWNRRKMTAQHESW